MSPVFTMLNSTFQQDANTSLYCHLPTAWKRQQKGVQSLGRSRRSMWRRRKSPSHRLPPPRAFWVWSAFATEKWGVDDRRKWRKAFRGRKAVFMKSPSWNNCVCTPALLLLRKVWLQCGVSRTGRSWISTIFQNQVVFRRTPPLPVEGSLSTRSPWNWPVRSQCWDKTLNWGDAAES